MKTKLQNLLAVAAITGISQFTMAQFQFAKSFGITGKNEAVESTAIDNQGNLFVTGAYYNNTQFQGQTLEQSGIDYKGTYLSKLNNMGEIQWLKSYRATEGMDYPRTTVNANGDVFFVGKYTDDLTIGGQTINSGSNSFGGGSMFVVKFDNAGNTLWVKNIETRNIEPRAVSTDNNGDLYITGNFDEKIKLEGTNELTAWSGLVNESFFMKLNGGTGTIEWAGKTTSKRESGARSITPDNAGNIYISGFYNDSLRFSPTVAFPAVAANSSITPTNVRNGFIAKYNAANGNFIWAKQIKGQVFQDHRTAFCNGNLYAISQATHYFNYDNDSIAAGNYLLKIDPSNGNKISQKSSSFFNAIAADGDNAIYFSNDSDNNYSFDTYSTTEGKKGFTIGKLDNNGELEWVEIRGSFGTTMYAHSSSLYAKNGKVFIGGSITAFSPVIMETGMEIIASETLYQDAWYAFYSGEATNSLEETENESFKIYPNPSSDFITIERGNNELIQLNLVDLSGKTVKSIPSNQAKEIVNIEGLQSGIYFIQFENKGMIETKKIIVK